MEIRSVAVLGSGRLGRGIAECAASNGLDVTLFTQGPEGKNAPKEIEASLDHKLAKWGITEPEKRLTLSRITYSSDLKELKQVNLVVDATVDDLYHKQELLRTADRLCGPDVVFISTSSTLTVSKLAKGIARSQSLVGLHFIQPVTAVPVCELTQGAETSDDAVKTAADFGHRLGKTVYSLYESPGLVNTRSLMALVNEAAYMIDEATAEASDAEEIIRGSWGMNQGPLEMADRIGLDVVLGWMEQLHKELGSRFAPCPLIRRYVRNGYLGVKSGRGFLAYNKDGYVKDGAEEDLH